MSQKKINIDRESKTFEIPEHASPEDLRAAATEAGLEPTYIEGIIKFTDHIKEETTDRNLQPPQIISACVYIVGEVIRKAYDAEDHADICTDTFQQLWDSCELPRDNEEQES
jgi:hypothetical protein|tara:strand:- start:1810 stop:2145 length:336 start_codon:yes stop_codon:yes gene_type:complete